MHQRNIIGMFEIGFPDESRVPVRAATVMGQIELLNAEHVQPTPRQVVQRGAAHATHTENNACRA